MKKEKQIEQITEAVLQNLIDLARKKYKRATSSKTGEGIRFRDTNINLSPKAKAFALLVNKAAKGLGLKAPIITSALRTAESQANAMFDIWNRQGKEKGGTEYIKKLYGEMCKSCSPNAKETAEKLTRIWEKESNKKSREEIIQKTTKILAAEEISMHQSGDAIDYGTTINSDKDIQAIIKKIKNENYADFELIDERVPDENGVNGKGSGSHWHISVNSITPAGSKFLGRSSFLSEQVRQKFDIALPTDLETLSDIFKRSGKEFYLVGGSVRDALLGKAPKDFDVTTNATPDEVEEILGEYPEYKVLELGKAFGIVKIITPEGNDYEIATFRTDIGKGRRPDRVEFATIEKDVNRRDLTMNALFYDISNKEIVDYVGGIKDIENKIVKTVGNAKERFDEDRLRILRALRFAARFGTELDKEADEAITQDNSLEGISGERIRDEFLKGIKSSISPINFYQLIERYNLWKQIFPGLDVYKKYPETKDIPVALALLLQDNESKIVAIKLNKAKYTGDEVKQIQFLLDFKTISPETAFKLKKLYKISGLNESSLRNFAESIGIPARIIEAFIKYEPSVSSDQFPELSGKELGLAIANREKEKFKEILSESKTNLTKLLEELKISTLISEQVIEKFGIEKWDWGLHPMLGPESWNFYKDNSKDLYFDPNSFTKQALEEYESTNSKGSWNYARPTKEHNILKANKKEKKITIFTSLSDPRVTYALKTSANYIPELRDYDVLLNNYFSNDENLAYTNVGKLKDLLQNTKKISGKSPAYSKEEEQFKQFEYEVFKDISEHSWYHATRESNLSSINEKGLLPSKEFKQGSGWTEFNFNLQNAVYLTANKDYAENIAITLSERYEESAVVLKIDGAALKDYSKLIVDEDSLRNEYTDKVEAGAVKQGMADYLTSVVDTIQSIGYKGRIAPEYISVENTIAFNFDEESDETIKENKNNLTRLLENLFIENDDVIDEMAIK